MFVHFKPIDHDALTQREQQEIKDAAAERQRMANPLNRIYSVFAGDSSKSSNSKSDGSGRTSVGGHEQAQHDEGEVARHMEDIDREARTRRKREALSRVRARRASAAAADGINRVEGQQAQEDEDEDSEGSSDESGSSSGGDDDESGSEGVVHVIGGQPLPPSVQKRRFTSPDVSSRASADAVAAAARGEDSAAAVAMSMERGRERAEGDSSGVNESEFIPTEEEKHAALRYAASRGDTQVLRQLLDETSRHHLHQRDQNHWQLLHEAVRSGNTEAVQLLVDLGADVNAKVANGGTPLWLAKKLLSERHPVVSYLIGIGAADEDEL